MRNYNFRPASLLLGALLLIAAASKAQPYTLTKSADEIAGPQHELISLPGGEYITITYPFDDERAPVIVSRFDHALKQKYAHPNPELSREDYLSAVCTQGRLFLLCSNREGSVNRYEVDENTGALTGSPTPLFDLPGKAEDCTFLSGSVSGSTGYYLVAQGRKKHEKGMTFQGVILDQQGNKTAAFAFTTPEDGDNFGYADVLQNDKGGLFLIYSVNQKTAKDNFTPYAYTMVAVDATGKTGSFALNGLPAGDLRNLSWTMLDGALAFTGLLAPAKTGGFRSVCSGTVDPAQKKVVGVKTTDLATLMNQATAPYKAWVSENASLVKTLCHADGSRTLLLETKGVAEVTFHYSANDYMTHTRIPMSSLSIHNITVYERNHVYLLKVDRSNSPLWLDIITKKQAEGYLVLATGTAAAADAKGNIYLFFADSKNNTAPVAQVDKSIVQTDGWEYKKNVLACLTVAPDGTVKKQFVEDQQDPEFRPIWTKAIPTPDNDLFFLAIKPHKAFGMEKALTNSQFRLGTITIK